MAILFHIILICELRKYITCLDKKINTPTKQIVALDKGLSKKDLGKTLIQVGTSLAPLSLTPLIFLNVVILMSNSTSDRPPLLYLPSFLKLNIDLFSFLR